MSVIADLARRLAAGQPLFSAWCGTPDAGIAELLAGEGFDAVVLDMQHGPIGFETMTQMIAGVAALGRPSIVRVPVEAFATASRALDAGAAAVIAPMINSVEDARRFASFVKFPPLGSRSWGPHRAQLLSGLSVGDYVAQANGFSLAIAMIETRAALQAVDAILDEPGIDGVLVGPADLSIALSDGAGLDPMGPAVQEALRHVAACCKARGKFASVFCHSPERAVELSEMGYRLMAVMSDRMMLRAAAGQALAVVRTGRAT
ncbi:HpcH/HpaI aldolase family protein [Azospirillum thermophilum]|uniref:Hydroxyacid aldolase n=1 Tax=Azospirillum thermophilum TaxID=2202148 RepID=A0A2S2CZE7_9PROT|nr:aldolase/citrate lyase family protein [Azospirillum thermophilum]AWK89859.1 hydroxyacid aldolase [Azospirillum thermophilum]